MIRTFPRFAALFLLVALAVLSFAPARVLAHANYESSTPAANATVSVAPTQVVAVFSEELLPSSRMTVTDASGATVSTGNASLDTSDAERRTMIVALRSGLGAGVYTVAWTTDSTDGHSESGTFSFSVAGATSGSPAASSGPGNLPRTSDGNSLPLGSIALAALVLLGVGLLLRRRVA